MLDVCSSAVENYNWLTTNRGFDCAQPDRTKFKIF